MVRPMLGTCLAVLAVCSADPSRIDAVPELVSAAARKMAKQIGTALSNAETGLAKADDNQGSLSHFFAVPGTAVATPASTALKRMARGLAVQADDIDHWVHAHEASLASASVGAEREHTRIATEVQGLRRALANVQHASQNQARHTSAKLKQLEAEQQNLVAALRRRTSTTSTTTTTTTTTTTSTRATTTKSTASTTSTSTAKAAKKATASVSTTAPHLRSVNTSVVSQGHESLDAEIQPIASSGMSANLRKWLFTRSTDLVATPIHSRPPSTTTSTTSTGYQASPGLLRAEKMLEHVLAHENATVGRHVTGGVAAKETDQKTEAPKHRVNSHFSKAAGIIHQEEQEIEKSMAHMRGH